MYKTIAKVTLASFILGTSSLIPQAFANSKTLEYTIDVKQKMLSVEISNENKEPNFEIEVDRDNTKFELDTITVKNTGEQDAIIRGKATTVGEIKNAGTFIKNSKEIIVRAIDQEGSENRLADLIKEVTTLDVGEEEKFDIEIQYHKDLNDTINLTLEFEGQAK